jgi:hypothetical protein
MRRQKTMIHASMLHSIAHPNLIANHSNPARCL